MFMQDFFLFVSTTGNRISAADTFRSDSEVPSIQPLNLTKMLVLMTEYGTLTFFANFC